MKPMPFFCVALSVARDGEGRLMVVDAGWGEIRVFDAVGEHVLTIGREG